MTLTALYRAVGGDISEVLERLEDSETIALFVLGFEDDPSYAALLQNLKASDQNAAFRAAHTLKGISYNFGFKRLGDTTATICEKLREGFLPTKSSLRRLANEYKCVLRAIHNLKNSN